MLGTDQPTTHTYTTQLATGGWGGGGGTDQPTTHTYTTQLATGGWGGGGHRPTNSINTRLHVGPVFKVVHPNSEPIKRSVKYAGAVDWNNLDADVRNIDDITRFKRVQKSWMLKSFSD